MESKALIILGNGFDVALGIPTRYSQFYEKSQTLRMYALSGNKLCQHIIGNIKGDFWSDLECGLYNYSLAMTEKYGEGDIEQAQLFEKEFNELRTALFNYLNSVSSKQVDIQDSANAIGLNVEWSNLNAQFLTFNYSTTTFVTASMNKRIFLNNDDSVNERLFLYQHGSLYNTQGNPTRSPQDIVVGIDKYSQPVEALHSFLYKTNQKLHDLDSTLNTIENANFYIVYGCSIGDSDATYFKKIFDQHQTDKTFIVYGFGQASIDSIRTNISKFCNLDELGANNNLMFLDLKSPTETRNRTKQEIAKYNGLSNPNVIY